MGRFAVGLVVIVSLAGCWNGGNSQIRLGDVSLGQQLIDLKRALDADAMTPTEYEEARRGLLSLSALCQSTEDEDS